MATSSTLTGQMGQDEDDALVPKPGTKSLVWGYFGLKAQGKAIDDGRVVCRSCQHSVVAKNGNTSNLISHLKVNHSRIYSEFQDAMKKNKASASTSSDHVTQSQIKIQTSMEKCQLYEKKGKKWNELTASVTNYIAKEATPIRTVEKQGFKAMLKTFDSRYELPSRKYFSQNAIPNLYTSVKEKVKLELASAMFFSATTDLWSSPGMTPFISYTVHFIDSEWNLRNRCLQTQFIPEDHTGDNLGEAMKMTLECWNLDASNQVCLTTDNGSNLLKLLQI